MTSTPTPPVPGPTVSTPSIPPPRVPAPSARPVEVTPRVDAATPSRRRPRRLLAGAGMLLIGAVAALLIGTSSGSDAPVRPSVPVVEDGRWGGPDVYEQQHEPQDEGTRRYGSADVLERPGQI
ncbi:hypothetical protein [Blastococcus litoris]|uniref:hypothetical protein n=1 Tax=Blastococcus litoris TaxID=2171622 RepID=UPI000E305A47|nr:hypothetical protein [Blastococcus litoris]